MALIDKLRENAVSGRLPFHMPGHKRSPRYDYLNGLGAALDITEIDGFDNLHNPHGILAEGMALLAAVYGAERSFFLVNGSTGGLLAAVRCTVPFGGEILVARNCHKAVYAAMELVHAVPHYLYPPRDPAFGFCLGVSPSAVEEGLSAHPATKAVLITSPTYDGVVSDVAEIAGICRQRGIPLIVDEAHGAHLGFLDPAVKSAVACGADVVIQSFHKTLPSLTQTAAAHVSGPLVSPDRFAAALSVFETSSPSYLLLASLDGCTRLLSNPVEREAFFSRFRDTLDYFDDSLTYFSKCHIFQHPFSPSAHVPFFDRSKIILAVPGWSGDALSSLLQKRGIEPEMAAAGYVLLMSGADLGKNAMDALLCTMEEAERGRPSGLAPESGDCAMSNASPFPSDLRPAQQMTPAQAGERPWVELSLNEIPDGAVSADYVFAYPPGIPLLVPGETVDSEARTALLSLREEGRHAATLRGGFNGRLAVIR